MATDWIDSLIFLAAHDGMWMVKLPKKRAAEKQKEERRVGVARYEQVTPLGFPKATVTVC
jgi:hypothetical protein